MQSNRTLVLIGVAGVAVLIGLIAIRALRTAGDGGRGGVAANAVLAAGGPAVEGAEGGLPAPPTPRGSVPGAPLRPGQPARGDDGTPAGAPETTTIGEDGSIQRHDLRPEAATALTIDDEGYGAPPAPELAARVDRAVAALPSGRPVADLTFGCRAGGADCMVRGRTMSPTDVRDLARQLEQDTSGEQGAPTVSIEETNGASTGETTFKMNVFYP